MVKHVYILELSENKWYVGTSDNYKKRIEAHKQGNGCEWTRKYNVLKCFSYTKGDEADEEITTLRMMKQHGIDNVRGGSYSKVLLTTAEKKVAQQQIHSINNECYKCGEKDHKASECISDMEYCGMCCQNTGTEIVPVYGKVGIWYACDGVYIPCPGCQPGYGNTSDDTQSQTE